MLRKIQFQPGVNREGTQFSAGAAWYNCDKIRFRKGRPEAIGGWEYATNNTFMGVCRSLFDWATSTGKSYLGLGTNLKFYVETGGAFYDITPLRATTAAGGVTFARVNIGEPYVLVTDTDHGAVTGDYVTFSGVEAGGLGGAITGDILNQEFRIDQVLSSSTYAITAPVNANSSDTESGGAASVGAYQINIGTNVSISTTGYGSGVYSSGTYSGSAALTFAGQLRLYSQDEWGEDLIFNPRAGGIYFWDTSAQPLSGSKYRAVHITDLLVGGNAPENALQIMVSQVDKHVIAFGATPLGSVDGVIDPLLVRWSTQENAGQWTPKAINSAGGQVLPSGTEIRGAIKTRQEILIFTDKSIHAMRYSGSPYVYQFSVVSENMTMISPQAAATVGDAVFFMGKSSFHIYNGNLEVLPCTVQKHVFSRMDATQAKKVYAEHNPNNSEVTWHYPVGLQPAEITDYVTYNYEENVWTIGTFNRGAWIQAQTRNYPLATSNDLDNLQTQYLYEHESGYDDLGQPMNSFCESGIVDISSGELGDGESMMFIDRFIPDFSVIGDVDAANVIVTIWGNKYPHMPLTLRAAKSVTALTKQSNVRVKARGIAFRVDNFAAGYRWGLGDFRFDIRTDAKR